MAAPASAGAGSDGTGTLNIARINGPFKKHSLGNLKNARSKAVERLANPNPIVAMTHNANRNFINAINRHIGFRENMTRRTEAAALERRKEKLAEQRAAEAAAAAAAAAAAHPPPPALPLLRIGSPLVPKQRRTRRKLRRLRQ